MALARLLQLAASLCGWAPGLGLAARVPSAGLAFCQLQCQPTARELAVPCHEPPTWAALRPSA
eukprot:5594407-Pyramimonas_sp.AAC.1